MTDADRVDPADAGPINITRTVEARFAAIGNLAPARFELDGLPYASVEGFWQGLKFPDAATRSRVAALSGIEAKQAGDAAQPASTFLYRGATVVIGSPDHWALMERACSAKFAQDARARAALRATGSRPLTHILPVDSKTIPGAVMVQIWMRIRERLSAAGAP